MSEGDMESSRQAHSGNPDLDQLVMANRAPNEAMSLKRERPVNERAASEMLGLSVATLRAWRHRRTGPRFVRFGRAVRYLVQDLEQFIQDSMVDRRASSSSDHSSEGERISA